MRSTILLKVTGEIFTDAATSMPTSVLARSLARQIKKLADTHHFGIVIGGGNFFRGSRHGTALGLNASVGHQIGMLATMMNGLTLKDLFEQEGLPCTLFCAVPSAQVGTAISHQTITEARAAGHYMIFTGGTGNPFFTTDTTAVLRGLQIQADEIWKGTLVDGIFSADPKKDPYAAYIPHISYEKALFDNLGILDATAITLAREHALPIRVFNIFKENALLNAALAADFGSRICPLTNNDNVSQKGYYHGRAI
jgi:uridylate kinase